MYATHVYVHVIAIKGKASMNLRRAIMAWEGFGGKKKGGINNYKKNHKMWNNWRELIG